MNFEMFDLSTVLETGGAAMESIRPNTMYGALIAFGFLIAVRSLAWCWKRTGNSQLTNAICNTLEHANVSNLQEAGNTFATGNMVFTKDGVQSINERPIDGHLSRKERKRVRTAIASTLVRLKKHQNQELASLLVAPVAAPVVAQSATDAMLAQIMDRLNKQDAATAKQQYVSAPAPRTVAPTQVAPALTAKQQIDACLRDGKFDLRTAKGIAKTTGLHIAIVVQTLNNGGYTTKKRQDGTYVYGI